MHDIVATKATWDEEDPAADADGWGRRSTTETALDDGNGACRVVKTSPSRKVSRVQSIATTAWPSTDPNDPLTGAWVADADGLLWYEQQQMPGDGEPEHIETLRLVTMPLAPLHDEGSFIDGSYKREIVQRRDAWCWSYEDTVGWPRRERPCARRPSDRNGSEPPSTEDDFHGYFTKPAR